MLTPSPDHHGTLQRTSSTSDEYICYISDSKNTEKKFPIDRKKLERLILGLFPWRPVCVCSLCVLWGGCVSVCVVGGLCVYYVGLCVYMYIYILELTLL